MAIRRKLVKKNEETLLDLTQAREKASNYFERNQKPIVGILAALIILVGGWFIYSNLVQQPREEKAMAQLWKAQFQFEQDSFQMALENPGGGYLGFLTIIKDFKGTKAANLAQYYAGSSYLNLGAYDLALPFLEDYKPGGLVGPILKYGALGDVYSELNQMDKAVSAYRKASEVNAMELLTPYYMKKLALLYESRNEVSKALDLYRKIKVDYPTSTEALSIDKYIARAEGVQ